MNFKDLLCFIIMVCGMVYFVGLVLKYWFEKYVCFLVEIDIVSEFCYCEMFMSDVDSVLFIF